MLSNPIATSDGFSVQISNYDANFTWTFRSSQGVLTQKRLAPNILLVKISKLKTSKSVKLSISTQRRGFESSSLSLSAKRKK